MFPDAKGLFTEMSGVAERLFKKVSHQFLQPTLAGVVGPL
jgi:hypothetical protein